ncbi:glyoxal oxidase [Azohydromonas aeria]|uniref:glyoxal oxidase n=1 Tax=Azohydromonas aeria TaxID=2590212 RepID=UPI0018DFB756|nr:glyoxal oxidase [Azohydromonas aeria]
MKHLLARALGYGALTLLGAQLAGCHGNTEQQETHAVPQGAVSSLGPLAPARGGPRAHVEGAFGPTFAWPVMPIHMVLLPDQRVMAYGTDVKGRQGAALHYTVWDPKAGGGSEAFLTLPNQTGTDLFCAAQSLLPDGTVALLGGDEYGGQPLNNGNADMNVFDPRSNALRKAEGMAYKRWYPTLVVLPSGDRVVLGGRIRNSGSRWTFWERAFASTPEVYTPGSGWRTLTDAASNAAYGSRRESFFYPRAWLAPAGDLVILAHDGHLFRLDPRGRGRLRELAVTAPPSNERLPAAMFAPGRILALGEQRRAVVLDINGEQPVVQPTGSPGLDRQWGNATVLADGRVWLNGGSVTPNALGDEHYGSEIWNPDTGQWTPAAQAAQARLYHSASMLLPDGSVVTGGGGAPGPLSQLNGEMYFPPYLFLRDGSGRFAPRPAVARAPAQLAAGAELRVDVAPGVKATRLTLVRSGSVTHSFNHEQRFMALDFRQEGTGLRATLPADVNQLPPGYWLVFVFDDHGVPSMGHTLLVTNPAMAG